MTRLRSRMPAEGGLVAEQLQRVDRLAAPADQEAESSSPSIAARDLLVVLVDLDLGVEVELVEHPLDDRADPLGRLVRRVVGSSLRLPLPVRSSFFFFRGGGGGGFAASPPRASASLAPGRSAGPRYCWPIVQRLVVIQ